MKESKNISILIIIALGLVPLILAPYTFDYFYFPKLFVIYIIVLFMLAIQILSVNKKNFIIDIPTRILELYYSLILLTMVFSISPIMSLWGRPRREEGLFALTAYALLFIFTKTYYRDNSKKYKNLIFLSAVLIASYGILQYFGYDPIPRDEIRISWGGRAFSTMGNPNFLGTYLVLMLPLPIFKYLKSGKNIILAVAAIIYLCLLLTFTRSALLGLFVIMIFTFIYVLKNRIFWNHFFLLMIIFVIIAIGVNMQSEGRLFARVLSIGTDGQAFIEKEEGYEKAGASRIYIWTRTIELVKERPLVGYGLENLLTVFVPKYRQEMIEMLGRVYYVDKAHNEYLHIAVSSGIPSLMAYLLFIFFCLRKGFELVKIDNRYLPYFTAVSAYLVQAFFNISIVSVAYIFWIFLGIITNESVFDDNNKIEI